MESLLEKVSFQKTQEHSDFENAWKKFSVSFPGIVKTLQYVGNTQSGILCR
jgi:hypothetical protein